MVGFDKRSASGIVGKRSALHEGCRFALLGAAVAEEGFIVLADRPTKDKTILQEVKGQYRVIDYTGGYFKSAEMSAWLPGAI